MQYSQYTNVYRSILIALGMISCVSFAADEPLAPQDHSVEAYQNITKAVSPREDQRLSTDLPSNQTTPRMTKEESKAYLQQHPDEFEQLLAMMLVQGNAEALEELLPLYQQVPNYDPSVIDWGNALIAANKGNLDEAITLYRKINAQLPDVDILRFQMAMALFNNQQFEAAQSEFERLRSGTTSEADIAVINKYLEAISKQDQWDFYASVSYLNDQNINNSPKEGTRLVGDDGSVVTYTAPREKGKGLNYYVSGDKKWRRDNRLFTALHLNSFGKYYWDNKSYSDVTAGIGAGIGYQNAKTEVEIGPFFNKRWYGQGRNGDDKLHTYADTVGVKFNLNQWLGKNLRYQGLLRYGDTSYIDKYQHNDGKDLLLANTAIYFPNGQQFWIFGVDYSNKTADDKSLAYDRKGLRLGWGQTWPKGYSTKVDVGYARRDYDAEDFFGIQRKNDEYSAGISFWKRDFTVLGLTPRLELDYFKVNSNSPFEEYDKTNVSVELTKTF
ncbi:surface lipoprotein assembly modifier [Psychrobacter lutiphocae]|uniref:surface lipoprotein assembly modifier n=1 Tax=Psychrobacter lutiphocae TaxID=540500 RepID=UPI000372EAF3|nr:surface lipoprotein assembly modifier [Psychrobacter lutiphocae]